MTADLPPIDDVRTPVGRAMAECEVHCVSACCGMDAYEVSPEHLQRWADRVPAAELEQVRREIDRAVEGLPAAPERFYFLDAEHSRAVVLAWFRDVQRAFAAVRPAD